MPDTNFNPLAMNGNNLSVSGPVTFLPGEKKKVLGNITVRFLIVQPPAQPGGTPSVIDSEGTWSSGKNWTATVPQAAIPAGFNPNSPARGIGLMVIVKQDDQQHPYFETVTWCVDLPTISAPIPTPVAVTGARTPRRR
jgi:hypothetical protein